MGNSPHAYVNQAHLEAVVRNIFVGENILTNVRKEASIVNPETGYYLELDIWIPKYNISFEFQDPYHYTTSWESHVPLSITKDQDKYKHEMVRTREETLVLVPCWWNGNIHSLMSTIHFQRPDLLSTNVSFAPIDLNPSNYDFQHKTIPDIGELMLASFPFSQLFGDSVSPSSPWWLGEKYDGIRCCWNSFRETLYTRNGMELYLPDQFYTFFPADQFIDGEIWLGRGFFQETQKLISLSPSINWSQFRVLAFDDPETVYHEKKFELRYEHLITNILQDNPFIIIASRLLCKRKRQLANFSRNILEDGGEGIIIRRPSSHYTSGRSTSLIKLKATRGDKEGLVVTANEDGSFVLQLPQGNLLYIEEEKNNGIKPKEGDVVTFSYEGYSTKASHVNPQVVRIRKDVSWDDVIRESSVKPIQTPEYVDTSPSSFRPKPIGYWVAQRGQNMRLYFEEFAKAHHFDPNVADNWYSVSGDSILKFKKGARTILQYFGGSLSSALISLFPDLGIEKNKFARVPNNYYKNVDNRRQLFIKLAYDKGLDPNSSATWYSISMDELFKVKDVSSIVQFYYSGSVQRTIEHLFPEIELDKSKFITAEEKIAEVKGHREYFIKYAKSCGFDPFVAKNWYRVTRADLLGFKGIKTAMVYHGKRLVNTLLNLFPDIGLDRSKLGSLAKISLLYDVADRRTLEVFARNKGLNPTDPKSWYTLSKRDLVTNKAVSLVLNKHKDIPLSNIVRYYFPEITFDKSRLFRKVDYSIEDNRKQFFINFAKDSGFDPAIAKNWYSQKEEILSQKDAKLVLQYHRGSITKCLLQLFPNIGLQVSKLSSKLDYTNNDTRIDFFLAYAKHHQFDPFIPVNWYSTDKDDFMAQKGAKSVLQWHRGSFENSLANSLMTLFPQVPFEKRLFKSG